MTSEPVSFPCAPMQAGLLFETLSGRSGDYVQQTVVTCHEQLDESALRDAWVELVRRHATLRTGFLIGGSALPRQRVHEEVDLGITLADWRSVGEDDRQVRWRELLLADRRAGFEPAYPPLMRVTICRLGATETRVLWTYHHAILDGRSRLALLRELFERYDATVSRRAVSWPDPPPFELFARWAASRGDDPATEAFWRRALTGVDAPTPAPGTGSADGASDSNDGGPRTLLRRLDDAVSNDLRKLASDNDLTTATILQGAFALLLAQEADTDDLLFATTRAGRRSAPFETDGIVGLLMVTSPVRLRLDPDESVLRWLKKVRAFNVEVRDFEHAPMSDLRRWSGIPRPAPIAETLFAFENASPIMRLRAADPAWENRDLEQIIQLEYPLSVEAFGDEQIVISVLYDEQRAPTAEADRILGRYEAIVRACVACPDASVAAVCELSPDRRRVLSGERTACPPPTAGDLVPVRIREWVRSRPDRIAIEHRETRLGYAEVGARADQLAAHLAKLGVGPGALVGVAMGRTPDMICAVLAVHRAGAAYVPLDPRYPPERLAFMLEDSGAKVVLTDVESRSAVPMLDRCCVLDVDALPTADPGPPPVTPLAASDLSHVIYTSGSTGTPKAVMVEHGSVAHLTSWSEATFSSEEWDGMLASTSLSFDVSLFEILVTLALGGRLVLVDDILALSDPDFASDVAFLSGVPSAISELLRVRDLPASVRTVTLAGEAASQALVDRLYAQPSVRAVWNLYGASEDTTHSTEYLCVPGGRPLIGRPIPGTQIYVVDRHLRPVPEGVTGELLLAGIGLARGYLGREELTAERFRGLAFTDGAPVRVYRTGDLGRWAEDGLLDYRGRLDDQVKIRGVRVEPGELAHALQQQDSIAEAAVVVRGDGADRRLVAYVVGAGRTAPDVAAVLGSLEARLPAALLPSAIVVIDALPLTPNGKLDRRALPEPSARAPAGTGGAAAGETQRALADVWADVLELSGPIGSRDDFFLLGGDSLSALHLLAEVEDRFSRRLAVGVLLEATTLADQAAAIDSARGASASGTLIPLRPMGARRPWICVLTDHRGVIGLRNVLPSILTDQPVYAIQAIDPGFPSWRNSSVEQIAEACLRTLCTRYPQGPYRLGGHSLGGLIAFEMARQLEQSGKHVELLILLDALAPEAGLWRTRFAERDRLLRHESLRRRARGQVGVVRNAVEYVAALAHGDHPVQAWPRGFDDPWDKAGAQRLYRRYRSHRSHRPTRLGAPVTVLCTAVSKTLMGGPDLGWRRYVSGAVTTRSIPGDHMTIFAKPDVDALAVMLAEELNRLDTPSRA